MMTKSHRDKGILQIDYNYLNLPKYIKFDNYVTRNGVDIYINTNYLYRADGVKLKKVYNYFAGRNMSNASQTVEYVDGFQYQTTSTGAGSIPNGLQFVPTSEGYYDFIKSKYIYSYTDHLGNVRLSYFRNTTGSAEVLEENNYYAFGMKHDINILSASNSSYKYQYNGKELQTETGWNDYGARMYMSDIGRWGVVDQLAETSRRWSPYTYAYNNPVLFIDPDGRQNISSLHWNFDPTTTINGSGWFEGSHEWALSGSYKTMWNNRDYGGNGMSFFTDSQGITGFSATGFSAGMLFAQLMSGVSITSMLDGFNSLRQELISAGWDKPEKTKANFGNYVDLITKVPALNNLYDLTGAKFKKVESKLTDGHVPPFSSNIEISMNNIDNMLEYAYVIGHELNHVVDNIYNWKPFLEIVPHTGQTANAFTIFSEYRSYSWEKKLGNNIEVFKKIEYTKSRFPAAYSIFEKYLKQLKNNPNFVTP